ncbi:MAG: hypothetical protein CMN73_07275 [Sphingomonas sp.]|nr:hypothetical protein [Sphingomonas sp.]
MRKFVMPMVAVLPLVSGGCVAKTVWGVATAPVRAGAQVVDWTTTSQEESDRNYGRQVREQERRDGQAAKEAKEACERAAREDRRNGYEPRRCD